MKILILGSKEYPFHSGAGYEIKPSGGIEAHIEKLAKYLNRENQDVFLVTRLFPGQKKYEKNGKIRVYRVPFFNNSLLRNYTYNRNAYSKSLEIIKREKIDIIHAHGQVAGYFAVKIKRKTGIPFLYTPHGYPKQWKPPIRNILLHFNKIAITNSDKNLFISKLALEENLKINPEMKYELLTNGIDFDDFKVSSKRRWSEIRFLFNGRLVEVKGIKELLKAFKKLKENFSDTELYITGEGTMKGYILNFIEKNKIKSIKFFGWVKNSPDMLSKTDVFVLPSEERGQPIALLEAMASGKIIITSLDYIEDGRTGIKVKARDTEDIYKKMAYVCRNFEKCIKYGENARAFSKKFDWNKIIKSFLSAYETVLSSN